MNDVPWAVVVPLVAVVLAVDVAMLLDLRRREVTGLPRWGWALVILLVSFPVGALVYWFVGRVPPDEIAPTLQQPPPPPGTAVAMPPPSTGDRTATEDLPTRLPDQDVGWDPGTELALATHQLTKRYDVAAVDGVELRVPHGAVYGLIGPNGAGKTTLLDLVAGLRSPTDGRVELGVPRSRMAVLPDTPQFEPWLTAREVVALAGRLAEPELPAGRVDQVLDEVDLVDAADRRCGGFSRGMLQRLGLATCLVASPQLLLLDEPSSALDPAGRREVLQLVGRLAGDRTVLLSTHVLTDVQQVCDTVGVLQQGRLVFQGPIGELLARTSSVYRLRVGGGDVADRLAATDWVGSVTPEGTGSYRLQVTDVAAAEAGIAGVLADAGVSLHAFGPAADLESAFLELTEGGS